MKTYKYIFAAGCFVFLTSLSAYSFNSKNYIFSSDLQTGICYTAYKMNFRGFCNNDIKYANNDKIPPNSREAVDFLRLVIKICPYFYENYWKLAFMYDYAGDYDNERKILEAMVKYMPKNNKGKDIDYGNLGRVYLITGNTDKAGYWLDKANEINPGNIINRRNSLICYILKKDFKKAAKELKAIDKLSGKDNDCYFDAWQYCMRNIKDKKEIIKLFRAACNDNPNSFKAHRALGIAIRTSSEVDYEKNMPLAIKEFKKALLLNSRYIPAYISMGDTYIFLALIKKEKKPFKEAREWFDKAYEIDPADTNLAYAMGEYFFYIKDYDKAIEKLEYAYSRNPENEKFKNDLAAAYNNKAYFLYKSGENLDYGIKLINKAIKIKPDDGIILSTKAELLYKLGKYKEAYEYIKRGKKLLPDEDEIKHDFKMIKDALDKK